MLVAALVDTVRRHVADRATLAAIGEELAGRGLFSPEGDPGEEEGEGEDFRDLEALREQRATRSKKFGIAVKGERSNLTPPKGYPADPNLYGAPTNLRYPADAAHALSARQYFNHEGQREKGGYTSAEWAIIGKRIARLSGDDMGENVPKIRVLIQDALYDKEGDPDKKVKLIKRQMYGRANFDLLRQRVLYTG